MKKINLLFSLMLLLISVSYGQYQSSSALTCFPAPAGTAVTATFTAVPSPAADGTITLLYQGDVDNNTEYIEIFDENGVFIAQTIPSGNFADQCKATLDSLTVPVTIAQLSSWAADGIISFSITPQSTISTTLCTPCSGGQIKLEYPPITGPDDAAVSSLNSPNQFCSGTRSVDVTIRNAGTNQIDSVMVFWELDGVAQPTFNYVGLLDTLGGSFPNSAQINLGSATFNGSRFLKVWTSMPNGLADTSNVNDTLRRTVTPSLNGALTIDAALPASSTNYLNFTSLAADLNAVGICGPVTVTVAPGTYNESFSISNVTGVSSINTITIDGVDSSTTTIVHDGTTNFATMSFIGMEYVTVRNMGIRCTANDGAAILFSTGSNYNIVENNSIWFNSSSTFFGSSAVSLSGSATDNTSNANCNYNKIQNNLIVGGYYSVYAYGTTVGTDVGNKVLNNEIDSTYYYGIYAYYQDSIEISRNRVDANIMGNIQADGIYAFYTPNAIIDRNYVHAADYGLYLYNYNNTNVPNKTRKFQVNNNMIISETDFGVYLLYADSTDFFFNSVVTNGTLNPAVQFTGNTITTLNDFDVRNNILYSNSTEALEVTGGTGNIFTTFDHNVFYTGGATLLRLDGTAYANLTAHTTATTFNTNSLEGDPEFVSPTDLHIIGSFVNDAGDNTVPITVDIDGESRPISGSTTVDPGADEFTPPANSAGVASIISPQLPICVGTYAPVVEISNSGLASLTSVNVISNVNGVLDTVAFTGNIASGSTGTVTLNNVTFAAGITYNVSIYTDSPNGMVDGNNIDDTLNLGALKTGLPAGNYTLDAALPASATNYVSFDSLASDLNNFGVCGAIIVNVAPGTYNESFRLNNVEGLSATNTLTIDGIDSSRTIITHDGSINFATISISGSDYVTVRNMGIRCTANDGAAIQLSEDANYNTIENNSIWFNTSSTFFGAAAVAFSGSATDNTSNANCNYNNIQNNSIVGGYYSVYMYGQTVGTDVGNKVLNNNIDSAYNYGVYSYYQDSVEISDNYVDAISRGNLQADGIYAFYDPNAVIERNQVIANDYGMYIYNFTNVNVPSIKRKFRITNNMVSSATDWGIYMLYLDSVDFFNNSVVTEGSTSPAVQIFANTTNVIDDYDFRNNIMYSASTEAFEISGTTDSIFNKFDNNSYYSGGTNLININGTTYGTLAAYTTAQPLFNASSLDGDPQFLSLTDLHIVGSFVNDGGDNSVPILVDIDGDVRPSPGATNVDIGADEFDPPTCAPVINLVTMNITSTSVDLDFIGAGNSYEYDVVLAGGTPSNGTVTTLDSFTVAGLTPNTDYEAYVREICSRGDTSVWQIVAFETNCAAFTGPYTEGFESFVTNETPDCWKEYSTNFNALANVWVRSFTGTAGPSAGTQALYIYPYFGFTPGSDTLAAISPQLTDLTLGNKRIRFDANTDDFTNVDLIVGTVDDPNNPTAFTPIDTIFFTANDVYANYEVNFDSANGYNGTDEFIYFAHDLSSTLGNFDYIRIDELELEDIPSCVRPDGLTSTGTGTNTADINWVNRPGVTTTQFEVEYGSVGFTQGTGTTSIVNANTVTLTGLAASTFYEVYVRGICGPMDTSIWEGPSIFQTDCAPISQVVLPFVENWDTGGNGTQIGSGNIKCGPDFIWEFTSTDPLGRCRFGTDAENSGSGTGSVGAVTLDRSVSGAFAVNDLILTLDMSLYVNDTTLTLDFEAMEHGEENHANDSTWIRGSDTSAWVGILDNWASITSTTVYQSFGLYDIDSILAANGQVVSSTFQIRFGQEDNFPTPSDGFSFDNIQINTSTVSVGINDKSAELSGVSIFPNPSKGLFTLNINNNKSENYNMTVRDVNGKVVYEENLNVNGNYNESLDFTSYAKGVYYMQIQTENESRVEKLIIQ